MAFVSGFVISCLCIEVSLYRMFLACSLGGILFIINDINKVAVFSVLLCIFTVFLFSFFRFGVFE
ncbi:hypothetical protein HanRHA438_Chr13g0627831 [Helianthus annuus]|nr:hypothetical protein HanRHA438_Chr13g0627831 [Helianthus annuus]